MDELLGLPNWLAETLLVIAALLVWFGIAWRNTRKTISQLKQGRPSPTREEFLALIQPDVRRETAEFLWDTTIFYLAPDLTPHPDDELSDLPIDEDDWGMDWPRDFANESGFHESNIPDWPEGWPVTIRNYGRWLELAVIR